MIKRVLATVAFVVFGLFISIGYSAIAQTPRTITPTQSNTQINPIDQVGNELKRIGSRVGVTSPTTPGPIQQAIMARMQQLSGTDLDRAYLDEGGVNAHLENASVFQREAAFGQNPDLMTVATRALPTINQHFTTASSLTNYRFAQVARRYNVSSAPTMPTRSAQ